MYIEHTGVMHVKNLQTGDTCEVEFKKRGWGGKGAYEVEGVAMQYGVDKTYKIFGKWNESLSIKNLKTGLEEVIWQANPLP